MRRVLCTLALGIMFTIMLPAVQVAGQGSDPLIGTWELNLAKSKFDPGPAPKSETRTYVAAGSEIKATSTGSEIKATSKGVDADGKPTTGQWTINYDGKDRPMTGDPDADSLSLKRIDAFSSEFTLKKAGKVVITGTRTISRDGKVMTITSKGTNAKGQALNETMVFEKR